MRNGPDVRHLPVRICSSSTNELTVLRGRGEVVELPVAEIAAGRLRRAARNRCTEPLLRGAARVGDRDHGHAAIARQSLAA